VSEGEVEAVGDEHLRQGRQVGARLFAQVRPRPLHRDAGVGVEVLGGEVADGRGVVVALDPDRAGLAQTPHHRLGVRPVADDVAELPDRVHGTDRSEHCLQCPQIGVDVRENRY